jgi:hypothetical protein
LLTISNVSPVCGLIAKAARLQWFRQTDNCHGELSLIERGLPPPIMVVFGLRMMDFRK